MKQVISAIERQIKLEEGKQMSRDMMIANQSDVLFDKPITQSNPEYLKELKDVLPILKYLDTPVGDWCKEDKGSIDVPDNLMPLFNKLGMQLRFHTISDKNEMATICSMVWIAQMFFHEFKNVDVKQVANNGI